MPTSLNQDDLFYIAVGRLILAYAAAEAYAHLYLRFLSGISDKRARVIFAGMRLGDIKTRIRGIARLKKNPEIAQEVDYLLSQLELIREKRDLLAHQVLIAEPIEKFSLTNALVAKNIRDVMRTPLTAEEMGDMRVDCDAIRLRFLFLRRSRPPSRQKVASLFPAWLYKPATRYNNNPPRRGQKKKSLPKSRLRRLSSRD
jgi:hypothetical protein